MKLLRWILGPKQVICLFLAGLWILNSVSVAGAAEVTRKNIDDLTDSELQAYEHAIQILKDRSNKNPYDKEGYLWQAWVHNCPFIWRPNSGSGSLLINEKCDSIRRKPGADYTASNPGQCEHGKDMFLPWHRAQFYYFEKLLQGADPDGNVTDSRGNSGPSTKTIGVPYWNWTRKPSGVRYPTALENKNSPLYHANRKHGPLDEDELKILKEVTNPLAIASKVHDPSWEVIGGYRQEASVGGYGKFESIHHNPMHVKYFGGDMEDPARAALDPGFFNFHSYIDLVFEFWLEKHGTKAITSKKHFLRADQPESVDGPPGYEKGAGVASMGQADIYFNTRNLGYIYEVKPEDRLPGLEAVMVALAAPDGKPAMFGQTTKSVFARLSGDGVFEPSLGSATMITSVPVTIPQSVGGPNSIVAKVKRGRGPDVAFTVDVYLHPKGTEFDAGDTKFRNRYVVESGAHLGNSAHDHGQAKAFFTDLTGSVRDLIATGYAGKAWQVTVLLSGQPPSRDFATISVSTN